jgi:hypothetical protein
MNNHKARSKKVNTEFVESFFCRDDNSRLSSGKKETKTYKGTKEQIRYLTSNLECLYYKFCSEYGEVISKSSFYKHPPFFKAEDEQKRPVSLHEML